jgi:alpha-beta hydrolase superfamily lysophospholipase
MAGSQKESWAPFATRLQEAGYAALALDLRGHGESGGESEWAAMPDDVAEAWAALIAQPEVDAHPGAIVGAGVGANLALIAAADEPTVLAAALLSPELEEWGLEIEEAMVAYGERPILIVASQDDLPAAESAQRLAEMARGSPALALYPGAGHGTDIFGSQPDLANLILSWLRTHLSS